MFGNALFANVLPSKITCVPRPGKAQFPNTHTHVTVIVDTSVKKNLPESSFLQEKNIRKSAKNLKN